MQKTLPNNAVNGSKHIELAYPDKMPSEKVMTHTIPATLKEGRLYGKATQEKWVNKLILGDNLKVLRRLHNDSEIKEKVRLVYIDPPFATGRIFDENDDMTRHKARVYDDTLVGSDYLEFLRERLILLKELLADNGSIYVHLDQNAAFYVKVIMDEIFGSRNFRNWITRKKCHPKGSTRNTYGKIQDFILFYSKSADYVWNRPLDELTPDRIRSSEYRYVEDRTGRIYKKVPVHAPGMRNGKTGTHWKGSLPPKGKHWQYEPEKLEQFDKEGRIYWSPTGNPRLKMYLDERKGVLSQDIWLDYLDPMNQFTFVTDYPTEKNQAMLEKIVETSSNKGDLVLDCFVGSGTTLAAAEKLNRRWIGVDNSRVAIETTIKRLIASHNLGSQPFRLYEAVR